MKTPKFLLPALFLAGLLLSSCQRDGMEEALLESGAIRLKVGDTVVFTYDEDSGQLGFSPDKKEFRLSNDDMSSYVIVTCSELPVEQGQDITASLVWTGRSGIQRRNNVKMRVQKIQGGTVWLWSPKDKIAAILKELR